MQACLCTNGTLDLKPCMALQRPAISGIRASLAKIALSALTQVKPGPVKESSVAVRKACRHRSWEG
jgi:hypothetical protein